MANIIDSLLITLGLDASKFEKASKGVQAELKKINNEADKTGKTVQDGGKKTGEAFEGALESLTRFGAALVSVSAAKQFITNQVQTHAQIGRTSQLLGIGVKDLDAWGKAVESAGGDANSFRSTITSLYQSIAKSRQGLGTDESVITLYKLGALDEKSELKLENLAKALKRIKDAEGELAAKNFADMLGLGDAYFLLTKNQEEIEKTVEEMKKLSGASDKNSEAARKLESAWSQFGQTLNGIKGDQFERLAPALEKTLDLTTKLLNKYREFDKGGKATDTLIDIATGGIYSKVQKAFGGLLKLTEDPNKTMKSGQINYGTQGQNVNVSSNPTDEEMLRYFVSKGWTSDQARGIVANIKSESGGNPSAVGDGGRAFGLAQWHPDRQQKFKDAFGKDIREASAKEQLQFIDYELRTSEKKAGDALRNTNDFGDAARVVSSMYERPANGIYEAEKRALVAGRLPPIGQDANPQNNIAPSTSTTSVNIQNMNIQTQATDPLGIANGMRDALANNALLNSGIRGVK